MIGGIKNWCARPSVVPEVYNALCCDDSNLCNLHLMPTLLTLTDEGRNVNPYALKEVDCIFSLFFE